MKFGKLLFIVIFAFSVLIFFFNDISAQENENEFDPSVILIGANNWCIRNLNVSTFKNGNPIPEANTEAEWKQASENKTPAWCWPKDANGNPDYLHGKLYNWYAVIHSDGLAPLGFRIPTKFDIDLLYNEAKKDKSKFYENVLNFKSKSMWSFKENDKKIFKPNGFDALPAGMMGTNGKQTLYLDRACYWSYQESRDSHAYYLVIMNNNDMNTPEESKGVGMSVRCVQIPLIK